MESLKASLADRYTLERELGRGGMATVYLARDLKHDRPVALKVLHPELAATLGPDRFLHEIRLTARLDHPHILPVHDSGEAGGLLWYTMPYVRGETLHDRLRREVQLPVEAAVELTRQVASALDYAHREGVVHRDLKPANILLCDGQARVADFGVAKALAGTNDGQLTRTGLALGTPAYMSPEQASGGAVDGRSDVYALGCVLYEMLAGEPPFTGPTPQAITVKRLTDPVPSLRRVRETVPEAVEEALRRALAKVPADRFVTAGEFVRALATPATPARIAGSKWHRQQLRPILAGGAFALVLLAAIAIPFARARHPAWDPQRVVIAPFENRTGDPTLDVVAAMATDWVTRGLMETGLVDIATLPHLASVPSGSQAAAVELAEAAAAGSVVVGSMYRRNDSLEFHADIVDANRREIAHSLATVMASATAPLTGVEALRQRVMAGLATVVDPALADRWPRASSKPPTFEAYRAYMDGKTAYNGGDARTALLHWLRAAGLDSTFTLPLAAAATALLVLDRCEAVDSIGQILEARGEPVALYDKRLVARKMAECRGDGAAQYREARELLRLNPLSETASVTLAQAALAIGRPREAVKVLEQLDADRPGGHGEWRYYWTLASALHTLGDYSRELEISEYGRKRHPEQLFLLWAEVQALSALGRVNDVRERLDQSLTLPPQTFPTPGFIMLIAAQELEAHGRPEEARPVWQRALAWIQRNPPPESLAPARRAAPIAILYGAGQWTEAEAAARRLATEEPERAEHRAWLGFLAARQGRTGEAEQMALELATRRGPYLRGRHKAAGAAILAGLGRREQAVTLLKEALAEGLEYSVSLHADSRFASLRGYPPYEELLRPKS